MGHPSSAQFGPGNYPFRGQVLRPGDEGYEQARRVFNASVDRHPALIAQCTGVADVRSAVRYARAEHLPVAVRGGGHGVTGYGTCDGGIVIDLSPMKGIQVDPVHRTAHAQAGVLWGEFDRETQEYGLATTGGRVSTTGIAGLTLGSGSGWLERRHGLTCDNLLAADVVTADGELPRASEVDNPDLFWGLRGGGGNFGVVTSFEYRLHPVGPLVLGGMLLYRREQAGEVMRCYRDHVEQAPDELGSAFAFLTAPPEPFVPEELRGAPMAAVLVCCCADLAAAEEMVRPLREVGPPAVDLVKPMPYTVAQTLLDAAFPYGQRHYWKSEALPNLADRAVDTLLACAEQMPFPFSMLALEPGGRAIARIGEDETPIGARTAAYRYYAFSVWDDPRRGAFHLAWARETADAMRPFAVAGIQLNFVSEQDESRVRSTYGPEKYARLVGLKNTYDPTNLFSLNQAITPTSASHGGDTPTMQCTTYT